METEFHGPIAILRLRGYIDRKPGETIVQQVQQYLAAGWRKFLVNFSGVPVIGSPGVAAILEVFDDILEKPGGVARCVGLNGSAQAALRLTGALATVEEAVSEEAAIADLMATLDG